MSILNCFSNVVEKVRGVSTKERPWDILRDVASAIRDAQQGQYEDGAAYRLICDLRPELEGQLTNYMLGLKKEWRDPFMIARAEQRSIKSIKQLSRN